MRRLAYAAALLAVLPVPAGAQADPSALVTSLQRLADQGNAAALYHLGMAYHTGSGVAEDHAKALTAFRKSAALGDPLAAYKLGCYFDGQGAGLVEPDPAQALKYKLIAAKAGYALAQQDVAVLLARGGDAPAAVAWLEKSAAQGWSGGLMALASAYNNTPGVAPDPAKTAAYFRLFLDRANASAEQRAWLDDFTAKLSQRDRERAAVIERDYRPAPTALTLAALAGQRTARALVDARP